MAITKVRVKINGTWTNLTKNASTGKWTGNVTAPSVTSYNQTGRYYPITIEATNDAGTVKTVDATDATLGSILRLVVKETTKPVIKLVQPSNGAYISNNKLQIIFDVTDETNGSGINLSTVALKLAGTTYKDGSTGMTKTEGTNTITVVAKDAAGKTTTITLTVKLDTSVPTIKSAVFAPNPVNASASVQITLEVE